MSATAGIARAILPFLLAGAAATAAAHDDDPKLLSAQPPWPGTGLRMTVPPAGTPLAEASGGPNFPTQDALLLSWLTVSDLSASGGANDCWGYTSPSGREYALIGTRVSTAVVEITAPQSPVVVATLAGPSSLWRDVKVFGTHAYAVSEGGSGIQVFDLSQVDSGVVTDLGSVLSGGTSATHNVAVDTQSGFLYRCGGGSNGLRMYSLQNPASPTFVGSWSQKYVHDAAVYTYPGNQQIAFCCAGFNGGSTNTGLTIVDVTNKSNPQVLDVVTWPNARYSHQVWLSEDRQYAYVNDELDENGQVPTTTHVIDVSSPQNAFYVGSFTNGNTAIGHNLYTRNGLLYEANYRSGLRVFDLTVDPLNPPEVAFFDTYVADDWNGFNGLWSVYPYFQSGVVIGSDMEKGLFVWWVGDPLLDFDFAAGTPTFTDPDGEDVPLAIAGTQPGDLVPGSAFLHYDTGSGLVSVPLVDLGGGQFEVPFPAVPCGSTFSWFLSADSTSGITWYDPAKAPCAFYTATGGTGEVAHVDLDMEADAGWTVGDPADDAVAGQWVRADPVGTQAQPEDDHSPTGTACWYTGAGTDVDLGATTLVTPVYDLSGMMDPRISYWRWYSNYTNGTTDDVFEIEIDAGGGWVPVEVLPAGPDATGGWLYHEFRVADLVPPSATVQVRFRASDLGGDSEVEAAIDDFRLVDLRCVDPPATYCTAKPSSNQCVPAMAWTGGPSVTAPGAFDAFATDVHNQKNGLLFYGYAAAALPFQGGTLCVQPPLRRTGVQISGGAFPPANDCSGELHFDFNALIQSGLDPALTAGASAWAQYWFRDPQDATGFGAGLSDGLTFVIEP